MKRQNKKWYNVVVGTRNGGKVFDDGKSNWTIMAKVQSKGNAYAVLDALYAIYKPEDFIIMVE